MKTRIYFLQRLAMAFFLSTIAGSTFSQSSPVDGIKCIVPSGQQALLGGCTGYAPFGRVYTPQGRLHVLVVMMYDPLSPQNLPGHPSAAAAAPWMGNLPLIPSPFTVNGPGPGIQNILFNELPSTVSNNQYYHNLSEYFYTFSNPNNPFIVTGLIYPEMIPVELPDKANFQSQTSIDAHIDALEYIAANETAAWWDQFDLRKQASAAYGSNNTAQGPDGVIDYIVFMQANNVGQGLGSIQIGGYVIPGTNKSVSLGHSFQATPIEFEHFAEGFNHEYAHVNMWGNPHYCGANNTHGTTFQVQNFYGMMGGGSLGFYSPTAWESWYNGWLTDFTEVSPLTIGAGVFELKDFATQHAAMRVEIPNSTLPNVGPQYIWLENRRKISYWDEKQLWNVGDMEEMQAGIYAFIAKGEGANLNSPCYTTSAKGANIFKPISADGAFDWEYTGHTMSSSFSSNPLVMKKVEQNPLSGSTYRASVPWDADNDLSIRLQNWDGNSNPNNVDYERIYVAAEVISNVDVDHWKYTGNSDEAFQIGQEISLSGNMPAVNYADYNDGSYYNNGPVETMEPTYLNGLSIKYIGDNPAGNALIQVRYDDYEVRANKRWCGNIILPDFNPNATSDHLNIATGVELRIDQSKTPHRETINPITGTWVNPTTLTVQNNGAMHLDQFATVIVENNSELILENGAGLEVHDGAKVIVKTNATLRLKGGSKLYVHDGGTVIIERGATIEYENGADIALNGFNSVLEIHGNLEIGAGANFTFHNGTSPNAGFIRFDLPTIGNGAPNITCGVGSKITLTGAGTIDLVAEVFDNTTVYPETSLANFTLKNGLVKMGKSASINTSDADFQLFQLNITAFQQTHRHNGVFVNGQATHQIDAVEISYGNRAITAFQFYNDGATLRVSNSNFHDCDQALVVYKKGAILNNVDANSNTYGYIHYYPTFNSRAFASDFNENTMRGVHVFSAGARLWFNKSNANSNGRDGVFYKGNGSLALTCASASYNGQVGVYAGHSSYLVLDNSVNINGAQSTIYKNPTSISVNWAKDVYLNKGRNQLLSLVGNAQADIKGRLMKTCPTGSTFITLPAGRNHWNARLNPCANASSDHLLDYATSGYGTCGIRFSDNFPVCPPTDCAESPSGGGDPESPSFLETCPECELIHTASFPNELLNKAILTAISKMEITDSLQNDLVAIGMFHEILTYNFGSLSDSELWLLDLAYSKAWETYSSACESGKINIQESANLPVHNDHTNKVLEIIAAMKLRAPEMQQKQSFDLDRASAYAYINRNNTAISILDELLPVVDAELQEFASLYRCSLRAEENVQKGYLPIWEFEAAIAGCGPQMKAENQNPEFPASLETTIPLSVKAFPNPNNGMFKFEIQNAANGEGYARLFDAFGKEVGRQSIFITRDSISSVLDFDASTLPAGYYVYRFRDAEGHVASGGLVIGR